MQHYPFRFDPVRPLRDRYEAVTTNTLHVVWRRKAVLAGILLVALIGATVTATLWPKRYTADAIIQLDLSRGDASRAGRQPNASLEASAVVETEARIIRSRIIAERVVTRLSLAQDPAFQPQATALGRLAVWLSLAADSETEPHSASAALIAVGLTRGLTVTNDTRSYLISIAFTADTPQRAAAVANAFAEEYLLSSTEMVVQRDVTDLSGALGSKHPNILQAESKLNRPVGGARGQANGYLLAKAEAIDVPSGPNKLAIIGAGSGGAFILGLGLVFFVERRNTSFVTETQVGDQTGIRCLGMIPEIPRRGSAREARTCYEAVRLIAAATGLMPQAGNSKVLLITSSVPQEGKSLVAAALTRALMIGGQSTLLIDASPYLSGKEPPPAPSLEDILDPLHAGAIFAKPAREQAVSVLRRSTGLNEGHALLTSPAFGVMLAEMRKHFEAIIIEAAPTMLSADALHLGRYADFVLNVVRWNSTPAQTVSAGLRRLDDAGVRVHGIALSRVDQKEHRRRGHVDACFYYRKYADFYGPEKSHGPRTRLSANGSRGDLAEPASDGGAS